MNVSPFVFGFVYFPSLCLTGTLQAAYLMWYKLRFWFVETDQEFLKDPTKTAPFTLDLSHVSLIASLSLSLSSEALVVLIMYCFYRKS